MNEVHSSIRIWHYTVCTASQSAMVSALSARRLAGQVCEMNMAGHTLGPIPTCNFMTSPQAGAPTKPVPTFLSVLSKEPMLRGFS